MTPVPPLPPIQKKGILDLALLALRRFVFQLAQDALLSLDVITRPQVDRLVQRAAQVSVEIANLNYRVRGGNGCAGRDRDDSPLRIIASVRLCGIVASGTS